MTKLLDRQPFKALYLAYFATSLFLVKIPFWTILYIPRSRRIRRTWTLKRSLIVRIAKELFSVKVDLKPRNSANPLTEPGMTLKDAKFVWIDPIPNQMLVGEVRRVAEINGVQPVKVPGYWLLKKGSTWAGPKAKKGEKTLLHMHGGAFYVACFGEPIGCHGEYHPWAPPVLAGA
ncbi:hypothetical protein BD414DRAFT_65107 [Trametes punicea]|nr:hypothetical protein BD414DRAFT_65107 [Trametes punicea]